jgi:hypothetical protein
LLAVAVAVLTVVAVVALEVIAQMLELLVVVHLPKHLYL